MSVDKILAQADKLLEKEKFEDAIEKLQPVFAQNPNNELLGNKLARAFIGANRKIDAVGVYKQLGSRAAADGKSQKALAMYRQGLECDPDNLGLLELIAPECEAIGKHTEAATYAQKVLAYYVPRKKYLDALSSFAILARVQPNDEGIRQAWVELLMYVRHELHLQKALVCLCGPPGISLSDFPVGGDPTKLSDTLYQALENLLPFYPGDPNLPYALAWICFRKGNDQKTYQFLKECFKRDCNYTLGLLLFARMLANEKKMDETLFVYNYIKERVPIDRSVDFRSLGQQVQQFEEKNGWLNFAGGFGQVPESLKPETFASKFDPNAKPEDDSDNTTESEEYEEENVSGQGNSQDQGTVDIFTGRSISGDGQTKKNRKKKQAEEKTEPALPAEVELGGSSSEEDSVIIQFTGESTKILEVPRQNVEKGPMPSEGEESAAKTTTNLEGEKTSEVPVKGPSQGFVPIPESSAEKTNTKIPHENKAQQDSDGDATKIFSPLELLETQKQKQIFRSYKFHQTPKLEAPVLPQGAEEEATKVFQAIVKSDDDENKSAGDQETIPVPKSAADEVPSREIAGPTATLPLSQEELKENLSPVVPATFEKEDHGTDLLEAKTKMIARPAPKIEKTSTVKVLATNLADRWKELFAKATDFFKRRNFYMARKTYRMAEKAGGDTVAIKEKLDQIRDLEREQSVFRQESSDAPLDAAERKKIFDELEYLTGEDSSLIDRQQIGEALKRDRTKIDGLLGSADPKVRLDLGIAFFEMGLYEEADTQFASALKIDSSLKTEVEYLRAQAKSQMGDIPGAITLLKTLVMDPSLSEKEKLPYYYLLGQIYEDSDQKQRSLKYYEKVAELDQNYRSIKEKLENR